MKMSINKKLAIFSVAAVMAFAVAGCGIKDDFGVPFSNMPEGFTITAHTGCMGTADNSLQSIDKAVECGAQIAEFDLRFFDGVPYLAHDTIHDIEGLVSLEQAFERAATYPNLRLNIDAKEYTGLDEVQRLAHAHGLIERVFYTGIGFGRVDEVKASSPDIPYFINVSFGVYNYDDPEYHAEIIERVLEAGALGINADFRFMTSELVDACRQNGLLTSVWTVDAKTDMEQIIPMRPDNITTRQPKLLRETLRALE